MSQTKGHQAQTFHVGNWAQSFYPPQILPEERIVIKDIIVARPALLFHGFQSVMFSKPVTIRVPFVPSITPGSFPLLLRLDFDDQSKGQWKNVADFNLKNGVMEFSVDHFSGWEACFLLSLL